MKVVVAVTLIIAILVYFTFGAGHTFNVWLYLDAIDEIEEYDLFDELRTLWSSEDEETPDQEGLSQTIFSTVKKIGGTFKALGQWFVWIGKTVAVAIPWQSRYITTIDGTPIDTPPAEAETSPAGGGDGHAGGR